MGSAVTVTRDEFTASVLSNSVEKFPGNSVQKFPVGQADFGCFSRCLKRYGSLPVSRMSQ